MECFNCKKSFESDNNRKRFCSGKCKVAHHRKNGKKGEITKFDLKILYNELLDLAQKLSSGQINQPKVYDTPKEDSKPIRKYPTHQIKSFQQYMNEISELEFEEEFKDKAMEIEEAENLTIKQKELLFMNLRSSKN